MWLAAGITAGLTLFLLGYVLYKGLPNITWELLSTKPSYLTDPDLCGEERTAVLRRLGIGNWKIFGAHGAPKDYAVK